MLVPLFKPQTNTDPVEHTELDPFLYSTYQKNINRTIYIIVGFV